MCCRQISRIVARGFPKFLRISVKVRRGAVLLGFINHFNIHSWNMARFCISASATEGCSNLIAIVRVKLMP